MTNITKEELEELIHRVESTSYYKPYIFIGTKEMIKKYEEYISYLEKYKNFIQKEKKIDN